MRKKGAFDPLSPEPLKILKPSLLLLTVQRPTTGSKQIPRIRSEESCFDHNI